MPEVKSPEKLLSALELAKVNFVRAVKRLLIAYDLLEFSVSPKIGKEYIVSIPAIRTAVAKGYSSNTLKVLIDYLKERDRKILKNLKVKVNSLLMEEVKREYPFVFCRGRVSFSFNKRALQEVKKLVKRDGKLDKTRREEILSWINRQEWSAYTPYDEVFVAEVLFFRPYRKKLNGRPVRLDTNHLEEFSSVASQVYPYNGRYFFPVFEVSLNRKTEKLPKVPVEMIPV